MKRKTFQTLTTAAFSKMSRLQRPDADYTPVAGDVALFECCADSVALPLISAEGVAHTLQPGQRFFGVLGAVYGPGDLEGYVPESLDAPLHVLHASGIVGQAAPHSMCKGAVLASVRLLSLVLGENGQVLHTTNSEPAAASVPATLQGRVLFVGGTDAQAGTRQLAEAIGQTLQNRGYQVARLRINGHGPDSTWKNHALNGANTCHSFEDIGLTSTYMLTPAALQQALTDLLSQAEMQRPDWVIVEMEQSLLQRESDLLLNDPRWKSLIAGVALAASTPIAAIGGLQIVEHAGHRTLAVGGSMLDSVLMRSEFEVFSDVPLAMPSALRKTLLPQLSVHLRNDWDAYVLAAS
ncbi:MAG: hypothetical protein GC205_11885 [Bacteroidetes bacterium]|nr:hypothetical protein [Bacteroidota bacterium]